MSADESDDDDCEYFLTPSINQYNIVDKIRQANEQNVEENVERQSQPKVRFKDIVDFEPEEESSEIMEHLHEEPKRGEESSDDGYIDDEVIESISVIEEKEETEEEPEELRDDKAYSKEEFDDEDEHAAADQNGSETIDEGELEAQANGESSEKASKKSQILRPRSSKDEIAKRELIQSKHKESQESRQMQQMAQEGYTASVNEEAFAKWLSRKMCSTVNKSNPINMFDVDVKPSRKKFKQFQRAAAKATRKSR